MIISSKIGFKIETNLLEHIYRMEKKVDWSLFTPCSGFAGPLIPKVSANWGEWIPSRPGRFTVEKWPRCKLSASPNQSARFWENIFFLPRFETRASQHVFRQLYRLRYACYRCNKRTKRVLRIVFVFGHPVCLTCMAIARFEVSTAR